MHTGYEKKGYCRRKSQSRGPDPYCRASVLLLQLFPKRITAHDLCSQGLESLSVDEVCRLMTDMGLGYCVTALRTEKMDGQKLKDFKRAKLVQLLQDFGIRSTKGTLVWVKIQTLLVINSTQLPPDRCPIISDRCQILTICCVCCCVHGQKHQHTVAAAPTTRTATSPVTMWATLTPATPLYPPQFGC